MEEARISAASTERDYDVIIIGSGMGGLTCASILAQIAGLRVLIIEQHFKPGGYTHTFKRPGGYHWDVGVHYVGEMQHGRPARRLMDLVTGGPVTWEQMSDPFEVFDYPGLRFKVRAGVERYLADLIAVFPEEEAALRLYFAELPTMSRGPIGELILRDVGSPVLSLLAQWLGRGRASRRAHATTADYLTSAFRDPRLRALLASQWGDHGLPPSQSALMTHAMVASHYLDGGFYPVGGAGGIAKAALAIVRAHGGALRLRCQAEEILIENGRAVGVRVTERTARGPIERVLRAQHIVSNAGAEITYRKLLADRPEAAAARRELDEIAPGPAHVNLFLGFKDDPRKLGFRGENLWIFDRLDHDEVFARRDELLEGRPHFAYVTFPSLKDPSARRFTGEIVAFASHDAFARWQKQPWMDRGAEYETLKRRIAESLIAFVDERYPGYRDLIDYVEVSTPITTEHLAAHPRGVIYGVAARPERRRMECTRVRTPIPNLYQASADSLVHGILGATIGGAVAAGVVLGGGVKGLVRILAAIGRGPTPKAKLAVAPGIKGSAAGKKAVPASAEQTPGLH